MSKKKKRKRFIPPLVACEKLSRNIEKHFSSPFLLVKTFHSYQRATSIVFNVVREPVKKNCQKFPQFLFFGFSLYQMDAWLIIPLMIIVHH